MIDTTISMGTLLQIAVMLVGGMFFIWRLETKILLVGTELRSVVKERDIQHHSNLDRFKEIDEQLKRLIAVTIELAQFRIRMDNTDQRLQTLSDRIEFAAKAARTTRNKG